MLCCIQPFVHTTTVSVHATTTSLNLCLLASLCIAWLPWCAATATMYPGFSLLILLVIFPPFFWLNSSICLRCMSMRQCIMREAFCRSFGNWWGVSNSISIPKYSLIVCVQVASVYYKHLGRCNICLFRLVLDGVIFSVNDDNGIKYCYFQERKILVWSVTQKL